MGVVVDVVIEWVDGSDVCVGSVCRVNVLGEFVVVVVGTTGDRSHEDR